MLGPGCQYLQALFEEILANEKKVIQLFRL
jgi:hypothetical protein